MPTLLQYINTLNDSLSLTKTMGEIDVCRNEQGEMLYSVGNSAVIFKIRRDGVFKSLRCYTRSAQHLPEIYGSQLLRKELYIYSTPTAGEWVDVILNDWVEGLTLHESIIQAVKNGDSKQLAELSAAFDRLGAQLVSDDRAHGDLKPENIIVAPDHTLHLIDFDAMYLPEFAGQQSPELGTTAFRHPARTAADFNSSLDDYPVALISTALQALALDTTLYDRHHEGDGILFTSQRIDTDPALQEVLKLFAQQGLGIQYRIAKLLRSPSLKLFGLPELIQWSVTPRCKVDSELELFVENGLWGYRTAEKIIIPPLYDCGFDFTEGLAAVRLDKYWHFIDTAGVRTINCSEYDSVKPFHNGRAQIFRAGKRLIIDHNGEIFDN